jgi:hypothetical protein
MILVLTIVSEVLKTMNTQLDRIETCLNSLTHDQIWKRLQPNMNSIGNLCVHLAGNEYQHFVSGVGRKPLIRERSLEFTMQGNYAKDELVQLLRSVRNESIKELEPMGDSDLETDVTVYYSIEDWNNMKTRNANESDPYYTRKLLPLLLQVSEHYGYHTGQIVIFTKLLNPQTGSLSGYRH